MYKVALCSCVKAHCREKLHFMSIWHGLINYRWRMSQQLSSGLYDSIYWYCWFPVPVAWSLSEITGIKHDRTENRQTSGAHQLVFMIYSIGVKFDSPTHTYRHIHSVDTCRHAHAPLPGHVITCFALFWARILPFSGEKALQTEIIQCIILGACQPSQSFWTQNTYLLIYSNLQKNINAQP